MIFALRPLAIIRPPRMGGRTLCATTSPSTSALSRSRTRAATRRVKAACGPSIQPRWRRCVRSCTSGGAKTPSRSAAAWRGQVRPSAPTDAVAKRRKQRILLLCLMPFFFPPAECLDRLLGERPNKFRHHSSTALLPRVATAFNATATSRPAAPPRLSGMSGPCAAYAHVQPRQSCYPAPALAHVGSTFALHSPCAQTAAVGGLSSPPVGMVPPVDSCSLQAQYGVSSRSIQDFMTEGFTGYDVDALNPSLTDLQLQGTVNSNCPSVQCIQKLKKCTARCHLVGVWVCRLTFFQSLSLQGYHWCYHQLVPLEVPTGRNTSWN